jgi:hypothetical protein
MRKYAAQLGEHLCCVEIEKEFIKIILNAQMCCAVMNEYLL